MRCWYESKSSSRGGYTHLLYICIIGVNIIEWVMPSLPFLKIFIVCMNVNCYLELYICIIGVNIIEWVMPSLPFLEIFIVRMNANCYLELHFFQLVLELHFFQLVLELSIRSPNNATLYEFDQKIDRKPCFSWWKDPRD
jgi:hypothetical protein